MIVRSVERSPTLQNLDVTYLELDAVDHQTLGKDIVEIVTGVSSNAITVGSKITAGTIIYTNHETPDTTIAGKIFWIGSLVASVVDFLLIPAGYLYKFYKHEKVPFNTENNIKWVLSGITLLLAIISAAVTVTSSVISFITAGLAIVVGIVSVFKYFYDYKKTGMELQEAIQGIEDLTDVIQCEMAAINQIQHQINLINLHNDDDKFNLNSLIMQREICYESYYRHCEELKETYQLKHHCERKFIRQKSPVELISNILKFALAGIVLAGTVLMRDPIKAPIGSALLATAAIASLLTIIAKKIIQIIDKRKERQLESKRNRDIEIPLDNTLNSTALIMKKIPRSASQQNIIDDPEPEDRPLLVEHRHEIPLQQTSFRLN